MELVASNLVENVKCDVVSKKDIPEILSSIKDMEEIVKSKNGLGIAAPQVGINKRYYLVLINGEYQIFCNAKYFKGNGSRDTHLEGCLSYPDKPQIKTKRWKEIIVHYDMIVNNELIPMKHKFKNIEAFAHQHEIDHINGKTIYMKKRS